MKVVSSVSSINLDLVCSAPIIIGSKDDISGGEMKLLIIYRILLILLIFMV
jgi:hypothetical protein